MSAQFPHEVRITPVTVDNFRSQVLGTPFASRAYIEKEDKLTFDANGQPVEPRSLIMLPAKTSVSRGDKLQITNLGGTSYPYSYIVRSSFPVGGAKISHIEVIV